MIDILCGDSLNASVDDDIQRQYSNNGLDFEEDDEFDGETIGAISSLRSSFIAGEITGTFHGSMASRTVRSGATGRQRPSSSAVSSLGRKKSSTILTSSSRRKREQKKENLQIAVEDLRSYFSHRNLDAIVRVLRITLEKLRKRITATPTYGRAHSMVPMFKVFAQLEIPNVRIKPSADEVQSFLNKAVQAIISVSKNVLQWGKDGQRVRVAPFIGSCQSCVSRLPSMVN